MSHSWKKQKQCTECSPICLSKWYPFWHTVVIATAEKHYCVQLQSIVINNLKFSKQCKIKKADFLLSFPVCCSTVFVRLCHGVIRGILCDSQTAVSSPGHLLIIENPLKANYLLQHSSHSHVLHQTFLISLDFRNLCFLYTSTPRFKANWNLICCFTPRIY